MESIWQLVLLPFSLLSAVIPLVAFLGLVWWLDRYDREPIWLVLLTFAWGALGGVLFALLGSSLAMEPLAMLVGPEQAEQRGGAGEDDPLLGGEVEELGLALQGGVDELVGGDEHRWDAAEFKIVDVMHTA